MGPGNRLVLVIQTISHSLLCEATHGRTVFFLRDVFNTSILKLRIHWNQNTNITEKVKGKRIFLWNYFLLLHALFKQMNCLEPQDWENHRTSVDCSESIGDWNDDHVLDTVLLWVVVWAKADDGTKGKTKRIKDLIGSIKPHCWLQQHFQLKMVTIQLLLISMITTLGVNMCNSPAVAPFKVIPRKKKIVRTT